MGTDEDHPPYAAMRRLILGTYGPPAVIAETFANLTDAEAVVLFGSIENGASAGHAAPPTSRPPLPQDSREPETAGLDHRVSAWCGR